MKPLAAILGLLVLLGALLAMSVFRQGRQPSSDCREQVVIVKAPNGSPLECVCIEGSLATCFNPGP